MDLDGFGKELETFRPRQKKGLDIQRMTRNEYSQEGTTQMNERMKSLLKENTMCVLATSLDNRPHCSLMGYVTDDDDVNTLFMVTLRSSQKYRNLSLNPHVSLLVDTRAETRGDRGRILALTISGVSSTMTDGADKDLILRRIVGAHPHLQDLAYHPDAEVISVRVETLLLLEGATTVHFEQL